MGIKYIKQSTLNRALRLHAKWLNGEEGGRRFTINFSLSLRIKAKLKVEYLDFRCADFRCADFIDANFIGADFRSADFSWANFIGANFIGVNFIDANFIGADFSSADFQDSYHNNKTTINMKGQRVVACQLNTSDENRYIAYYPDWDIVTAGCFQGTLAELKAKVDKVHRERNPVIYKKYQAVFQYIETVLELDESEKQDET